MRCTYIQGSREERRSAFAQRTFTSRSAGVDATLPKSVLEPSNRKTIKSQIRSWEETTSTEVQNLVSLDFLAGCQRGELELQRRDQNKKRTSGKRAKQKETRSASREEVQEANSIKNGSKKRKKKGCVYRTSR